MQRAVMLLLALVVASVGPLWGLDKEGASISQGMLTTHVYYLASDELGGRGTGTEGLDKAAQYIAKEFQSYGLSPGAGENGYFQSFEIPIRKNLTDRCRMTVSGAEVTCQPQFDFVPMSFSSAGVFEGSVVFVGYGVVDEEKHYDDYAGVDVRGKIALMLRQEPQSWTDAAGGNSTSHAFFTTKISLAKEKGAIGVMIANRPAQDGTDELESFETRGNAGNYGLPVFQIRQSLADKLLSGAGLGSLESLHRQIESTQKPASSDLKGLTVKGDTGLEEILAKTKNVVGILAGEGPLAKEYVVIGGHYDHLGTVLPTMMPQVGQEIDPAKAQIHNGADDNASGTAGVMELARIYCSSGRPKRSMVFVTFTAEEMGLLGSEYFVNHPPVPLENIVGMINMDMVGRLGGRALEIHGTKTAKEFDEWVDRRAAAMKFEIKKSGSGMGPSDHTSFYNKSIPVLFVFTGLHADYHKPTDDADKIDYAGQARTLQLVQALADDILNADSRPTYQKVAAPAVDMGRVNMKVRMGLMPSYGDGDGKPGMAVSGVTAGRPAEKAGIQEGDRILAIGGQEVNNIHDYMKALEKFKPGDQTAVLIRRGEQELTVQVVLEGN